LHFSFAFGQRDLTRLAVQTDFISGMRFGLGSQAQILGFDGRLIQHWGSGMGNWLWWCKLASEFGMQQRRAAHARPFAFQAAGLLASAQSVAPSGADLSQQRRQHNARLRLQAWASAS